ncbi:MAG: hypothetical protein AAFQ64_07540 [Pseudomonadota bacterium]
MSSKTDLHEGEQARPSLARWWLFAPFAVLLALTAYLGLRLGQPITETDIITHFAAHYVTQSGSGAAMTDCFGAPSNRPDVRLVVVCTSDDGTVFEFPSGPRGELRPLEPTEDGV